MSFSSQQRDFITEQMYKSSCCRRALLNGVLFAKGTVDGKEVVVSAETQNAAEFIYRLIYEFFGQDSDIYTDDTGGRKLFISFNSKSASNYITNLNNANTLFEHKCSMCLSSFLKGVYLVAGRATDPSKQYSLEFSLGERTDLFADLLRDLGLTPRIANRKGTKILYFRNSGDIEDFFGHAGLNKALFALMDAKAEGELRKSAMRLANCETNNIVKAVAAAQKQIEVIQALEDANLLSLLPDELLATAKLRLQYADLSLSQLSAVSSPPISKPGLSHRLKKIMELGEQMLECKKQ